MSMPERSPSAHIITLSKCVAQLPLRRGIAYVGARLANDERDYELLFGKKSLPPAELVFVPIELVEQATTTSYKALLNRITAQYLLLFPTKG